MHLVFTREYEERETVTVEEETFVLSAAEIATYDYIPFLTADLIVSTNLAGKSHLFGPKL